MLRSERRNSCNQSSNCFLRVLEKSLGVRNFHGYRLRQQDCAQHHVAVMLEAATVNFRSTKSASKTPIEAFQLANITSIARGSCSMKSHHCSAPMWSLGKRGCTDPPSTSPESPFSGIASHSSWLPVHSLTAPLKHTLPSKPSQDRSPRIQYYEIPRFWEVQGMFR